MSECEQVVVVDGSKEALFIDLTRVPLCVICGNISGNIFEDQDFKISTLPRQLRIQDMIVYNVQEVDLTGYEVVIRDFTNVPLLVGRNNSIVCTDIGNSQYKNEFYTDGKSV